MIPQEFEYHAPSTLTDALALLNKPGAKLLAGGMSLIPMMKLRLAAPENVIDLRKIPDLRSIRRQGSTLHIGAMVTHYELESTPLVRTSCPLLAASAASIGDVQIRNAGTIGGSVAHADPAADYPAALLALEARVQLTGPAGERELAFADFLLDAFTTALDPRELITAILVPIETAGTGSHYQKHPHPASGFPIVGAAARIRLDSGAVSFARVGVTGLSGKAYRAQNVELRLAGKAVSDSVIQDAAAVVAEGITASTDIYCSAPYRANLARIATIRAIRTAIAGAA